MKIHILHCGYIRVSETVPFGNSIDLKNTAQQLTSPDKSRVTLPVCAYLIEHPKGLILIDTGWCRDISPRGVYDPKAVSSILPSHLAAFYHHPPPSETPFYPNASRFAPNASLPEKCNIRDAKCNTPLRKCITLALYCCICIKKESQPHT